VRHPMTPVEFDAACRALVRRVPGLSCTSGHRSVARNRMVSGSPLSKHLIDMARDFVGGPDDLAKGKAQCEILGLWYDVHNVGSGNHLHVQGLAPGEVPAWWSEKYMGED